MKKYRVWCTSWEDTEESESREYRGKPDTSKAVDLDWAIHAEHAVEMHADYIHSNRDGWEATWPLNFSVRLPDGTIEHYEVEREYLPSFSARRIKEAAS